MDYAKDEIFNIRYNKVLNRLEIKNEKGTSKVLKIVKKHKMMSLIITTLIMFSCLNFFLIYNFMIVLQKI